MVDPTLVVATASSKLFTPMALGALRLDHRIILAPLTRNRGTPSPNVPRTWHPTQLNVEYYTQRATSGGLLITEATPVSLQASGMPGVPALFTEEQVKGWKEVVDSVHSEGSVFVMQLWHQGRNTHSRLTGFPPISASAVAIRDGLHDAVGFQSTEWEVPRAMSTEDIKSVINEYVQTAKKARDLLGFDGIEIHGANGYLPDQFLHSNVNIRTDEYGGTPEKRCRFLLELTVAVGEAIGFDRLGVRLSPFGFFNDTRGKDRIYQWTYLCKQLSKLGLAYVHLIEPRFDEARSESTKLEELRTSAISPSEVNPKEALSLKPFRQALGTTPCVVAGGYNPSNCWTGIDQGDHDAIAFGRYFCSNADLVERLKTGQPLARYDRSRFYGPFPDNEIGYTVHLNQTYAAPDEAPQTSHGAS